MTVELLALYLLTLWGGLVAFVAWALWGRPNE
jgi:hypothetical protein